MGRYEVVRGFYNLRAWGSGDQRAPHKPLLILYALGCWRRGESPIPFSAVNEALTGLLRDFGPPRKSYRTQDPFWRFHTEKVWIGEPWAPLVFRPAGAPTKQSFLDNNAQGQFEEELQKAFRADPTLIGE